MKKLKLLSVLMVMVLALAGCGSFSDGVKDGMNDAMNGKTESTEEATEEETDTQEETEVQEPETEAESETAEQSTESSNILLAAPVTVSDVMNGTKTEVIGEWAEIAVAKELVEAVTMDEFVEFCNTVVQDSGYNWYTISFGDGTGIQFQGSFSAVATYGTLDNEGCIEEAVGTIMLQEDGTYSYTENQE